MPVVPGSSIAMESMEGRTSYELVLRNADVGCFGSFLAFNNVPVWYGCIRYKLRDTTSLSVGALELHVKVDVITLRSATCTAYVGTYSAPYLKVTFYTATLNISAFSTAKI